MRAFSKLIVSFHVTTCYLLWEFFLYTKSYIRAVRSMLELVAFFFLLRYFIFSSFYSGFCAAIAYDANANAVSASGVVVIVGGGYQVLLWGRQAVYRCCLCAIGILYRCLYRIHC